MKLSLMKIQKYLNLSKKGFRLYGSSSTIIALVMRGAKEVRIITELDDKKILKDDYAIVVTLDQEAEKSLETVILE